MKKQKRYSKKRIVLVFFIMLVSVPLVSHFIFKYSGSSQWEFVHEIDGSRVYSMKIPGSVIKKYKVIGVYEADLMSIMQVIRDPGTCDDVGCLESHIINRDNYPDVIDMSFKYPEFMMFRARQYVVRSEYHQDPKTKSIYVDFRAKPELLPPDDCCVRVTHMHDVWKFLPLGDGKVQVEFVMDLYMGGLMPYFLNNYFFESEIHLNIPDIQALLDSEKYKNAFVSYVQEYE